MKHNWTPHYPNGMPEDSETIRADESLTQFLMRKIHNEIIEQCAIWIEEYGCNDPMVLAKALRRELKDV